MRRKTKASAVSASSPTRTSHPACEVGPSTPPSLLASSTTRHLTCSFRPATLASWPRPSALAPMGADYLPIAKFSNDETLEAQYLLQSQVGPRDGGGVSIVKYGFRARCHEVTVVQPIDASGYLRRPRSPPDPGFEVARP